MPTIQISDDLEARLSQYRHAKQLPLWVDTIEHLLSSADHSPASWPVHVAPMQPPEHLEIVYHPGGEEPGEEYPGAEEIFRAALIEHSVAYVRLHYTDGGTKTKRWNAENITGTSSISGNLRSGHLRKWQDKGIYKAEVSIAPFPEDE